MASVSFSHVGFIKSISPGVTQHYWWNNAADQRVWAFSVDAIVPSSVVIPGSTACVEITRVEYREIHNGGGDREKEIHYWIKNTGTVKADYALHMATIKE
jgi:hypothetical protein